MARSIPALVNPVLLRWARETAGLGLAKAASKIGRPADEVRAWESGKANPSIAQLREAARVYKRPTALFYLPNPPRDASTAPDLRRLPAGKPTSFSPELRFLIRSARERQEWLREFAQELGEQPVHFVGTATLGDDVRELAEQARMILNVTEEQQRRWGTRREALREWVSAVENTGVFVFQSSDVNIEEMRGFALPDPVVPVIVINAKDVLAGRIFTTLHEFVHILLSEEGVSNLEVPENPASAGDRIEVFSNAVAGEILVPAKWIEAGFPAAPSATDIDGLIEAISESLKVSREVVARRLHDLSHMSTRAYQLRRKRYQKEFMDVAESTAPMWFPPHRKSVRNNGRAFTRLVFDAFSRELISSVDLSRLLGVRLKHLGKIEKAVFAVGVNEGAS